MNRKRMTGVVSDLNGAAHVLEVRLDERGPLHQRVPRLALVPHPAKWRIVIQRMTSDRRLKASREGSKPWIYGT